MEEQDNKTEENGKFSVAHLIRIVVVVCVIIGAGVLLFSCIGVAVFFLPLLAGAFAKK